MSFDVDEIQSTLRSFRSERGLDPINAHDNAIQYLEQQIARADSDEDKLFLYHRIADQHVFYGRSVDLKITLFEIMRLFPLDPISRMSMSQYFVNVEPNATEATKFATCAVAIAQRASMFYIFAAGNLCRVARHFKDYFLMSETIKAMLSYDVLKESADCAYECDFLAGVPDGAIDPALIEELRRRCSGIR